MHVYYIKYYLYINIVIKKTLEVEFRDQYFILYQ